MNMDSPQKVAALFLGVVLAVATILYFPKHQAELARSAQLAALLSSTSTGAGAASAAPAQAALGTRTKAAGCALRGALPDPTCTPGAVFDGGSIAQMCTPGYSKTVRNVSTKTRKAVYAEYGIPYPQPTGSYEVDHLVPLAIGGDNELANLFPQPKSPSPGFPEKDLVEVYLQQEVCAGRVEAAVAQARIASDWLSIYDNLSPETLAALKAKYRGWSN